MAKASYFHTLKKRFHKAYLKRRVPILCIVLIGVSVVVWTVMQPRPINPSAYAPLLDVIAKGESRGNYNAFFGNVTNTNPDFTKMSVAAVIQWQEDYLKKGSASDAVGRYQIISPTLKSLIAELNIDTNTLFDATLQDTLAITLMERRGSIEFTEGKRTAEDFAHQLSKEWAALPQVVGDTPEQSYYSGDGLNQSLIESTALLSAIESFKAKVQNN